MFEQELELEKNEGRGFGPMIIIIAMVAIVVGGLGYVVYNATYMLKAEDATAVVAANLASRGASTVTFHSGHMPYGFSDRGDSPQYKLLGQAGLVKVNMDKKTFDSDVALTPEGESMITSIPEFAKSPDKHETTAYTVPLAKRQFVKIEKIIKISPSKFQVEYSWKWEPTKMGDLFDAAGPQLQKMSSAERAVMIDKYGADFYHAEPSKAAVLVVKGDKGWTISIE